MGKPSSKGRAWQGRFQEPLWEAAGVIRARNDLDLPQAAAVGRGWAQETFQSQSSDPVTKQVGRVKSRTEHSDVVSSGKGRRQSGPAG